MTNFCRNFTDHPENAAKCRKSDEEDRERLIYTSPAKPMAQKGREQLPVTNFDQEAEQPAYGEEEDNQ